MCLFLSGKSRNLSGASERERESECDSSSSANGEEGSYLFGISINSCDLLQHREKKIVRKSMKTRFGPRNFQMNMNYQ